HIDAIVLTHAHLDHSGYIPLLMRRGFKGPVWTSVATRELCEILLPDSGHLQERDAEFANKHGFSKHTPALPLYTEAEGAAAISLFRNVKFAEKVDLGGGLTAEFHRAGHILGAAWVILRYEGRSILFSGDLGRKIDPVMLEPEPPMQADYLVVESTYGDRLHSAIDPLDALEEVINRTTRRGGVVVIPAFAVGRTQSLLYYISELKRAGRIDNVPVAIDSPMAIEATAVFCDNLQAHKLSEQQCRDVFGAVKYARQVEDSMELDRKDGPMILISASGMATGGRILHHLKAFVGDPKNTVLFTGFQAGGTRGDAMLRGAKELKIHGDYYEIHAEVERLDMLSAHADRNEIIEWLQQMPRAPRRTFVTHGEPQAADTMRQTIEEKLGWDAYVPEYRDEFELH
ncbi:MAG: MBL fold metallo-hydrolase, partial [Chrysiogenetes bacterium]|nr:MBL fold metallo-hydrolase [Chrysiogenetes bacterium]